MANCNGNCAACGGCAGSLELTAGELEIISLLAQVAFLPVARRPDDYVPVYLEGENYSREEYSLILQCLEKKGLISLDYDKPLAGFNMAAYAAWKVHGSMTLTARGQAVAELVEIQGIGF